MIPTSGKSLNWSPNSGPTSSFDGNTGVRTPPRAPAPLALPGQRRHTHVAVAIARSSVGEFDRMKHTVTVEGMGSFRGVESGDWDHCGDSACEFARKRSLRDFEGADINLVLNRLEDTV